MAVKEVTVKEVNQAGVGREFIRYVSMNILSMLGLSLYILADTIFISNGLGSDGLAALNLVLPVYSFLNGIGLMLGMGAATRYSILRGEERYEEADRVFSLVMILGAAIGMIFTVIAWTCVPGITKLLGADGATGPYAVSYLRTILSFSIAFILNNILVCMVRNDDQPNLSMAAMLTGSFANILLDYLFIFPLQMGMFGAALATGSAPVLSMAVLSVHRLRKKNQFHLLPLPVLIRGGKWIGEARNMIALGLPSFITEFSSGIIMLIFNITILGLDGNIGVAAYGIVANLALIVVAVFTGVAQGIQPLLSRYFGSGGKSELKRLFKMAYMLALVLGILFFLLGVVSPQPIVSIFNGEGNAQLEQLAIRGLQLYFAAFIPMGLNIVVTTYLSCTAKAIPSLVVSMSRGCVLVLVFIAVLPRMLGMTGVWLTIPAAEIVTFLISFGIIRKVK